MITDSVQIADSLKNVVDYNWEAEMTHFQETFDEEIFEGEIKSDEDLEAWLKACNNNAETKSHVFYHLMVLKSAYPEIFNEEE